MDEYSDDSRYTITFSHGGYSHEVKGDAWITMELTAAAISLSAKRVRLTNNFNGAVTAFDKGVKIWSDRGASDSTA